ncbi:coenzyme PQQ synthesis protein D (PqqD) [Rathayibacter sp. PhB152]|nr:coenzyme PQQ synthesis protein D (PqqD) [Rathayibacter sp. PhB152]
MTSGDSLYLLAEPIQHQFLPLELVSSALAIWEGFSSPHSTNEIIQTLCANYGLRDSAVRSDVEAFVDRLVSLGLLEEVGSDPLPG